MALQTIWQAVSGTLLSKTGPVVDGSVTGVATDYYGRMLQMPVTISDHGAASEGSYFVASNGVAGAPVAMQTTNSPNTAVPSDVAPEIVIMNTNPVGGPTIYPKRIYRLIVAPGTASQTGVDIQCQLDNGLLASGTTGTYLTTANANPLSATQSRARILVGAIVKSAKTTSVVYCGRARPRNTINIALDEYLMKFAATSGMGSYINSTTGAGRHVMDFGAVAIPPQWTFSVHFAYGLTVTGSPTSDFEIGYIER